jgi:hypothetical protein
MVVNSPGLSGPPSCTARSSGSVKERLSYQNPAVDGTDHAESTAHAGAMAQEALRSTRNSLVAIVQPPRRCMAILFLQ